MYFIPDKLSAELGNPQSTGELLAKELFVLWQSVAFDCLA
jgi:hypothetical protein